MGCSTRLYAYITRACVCVRAYNARAIIYGGGGGGGSALKELPRARGEW